MARRSKPSAFRPRRCAFLSKADMCGVVPSFSASVGLCMAHEMYPESSAEQMPSTLSEWRKGWCAREDLNPFRDFVGAHDSRLTPVNIDSNACHQNPHKANFCALMQLSCQELSGKKFH